MANLLDQASIVLTPTAYDNGKVLCAKPSEPPYGDFDFSRNSAATRVNAQGLVENVQILSSNLVQNGDFSEEGVQEVSNGSFSQEGSELITNGNFTNNIDGWVSYASISTWDNGTIKTTCTSNTAWIRQNQVFTINKYYKVTFKAKASNISRNIIAYDGAAFIDTGLSFDAVDVYKEFTYYLYTTATNIILGQQGVSIGDTINFDNVSVREVGQDWVLGTGWSIGEDKAVATNSASGQKLRQAGQLTASKTYKLVYEVTEITLGGFLPIVGAVAGTAVYSIGTYTEYITTTNDDFYIRTLGTTSGSITNISVKEVLQDWTAISNSVLSIDNGALKISNVTQGYGKAGQSFSTISGKTYKIKFDGFVGTAAQFQYRLGTTEANTDITIQAYSTNQTIEAQFIALSSLTYLTFVTQTAATGVYTNIDNVSIIEITDDTNLPRINYEGFSYQDALGSELVTGDNSNFDTSLGNWQQFRGVSVWDSLLKAGKWTDNGTTGSPKGFTMSGGVIPTSANTSYILEFKAKSNTTDTINFNRIGEANNDFTATSNPNLTSDFQNYKFIVNTSLANQRLYVGFDATSFNNGESYWIDNVSVKEYLGQEVVPDSGCGSWLWEPQSTNLVLTSDSGTYGSTPPSETNTISPDGTNNAIIPTPTTNSNRYQEGLAGGVYSNGQKLTYSWYRKRISTPVIDTAVGDLIIQALINLTIFESTTQIQSNINGYDRFQVVVQVTDGSLSSTFRAYFGTIIGVGNSSVAYWGHQFEVGGYATSLIPTSGSTVTRNQDVCTNGGSLASINSTEGTLYFEGSTLVNGEVNSNISLSDGTNDNLIMIRFGITPNRVTCFARGSSGSYTLNTVNGLNQTDNNKIALVWDASNFKVWVNGTEVATNTLNSIPIGMNTLDFTQAAGTDIFYGKTKALAVWKEALSDQELTELTSN